MLSPKDRTAIPVDQIASLGKDDSVFFMGSCFSEEMHLRLLQQQQVSHSNPFGVIFHPFALQKNLELIAQAGDRPAFEQALNTKHLYFSQGTFHSLLHANRFQHPNADQLIDELFNIAHAALQQLKSAQLICITLGTAWIYKHLPTDSFVGNCHKLPQQDFQKSLTTNAEIQGNIQGIITAINQVNPRAELVFTVSPVRHLRDGVQENLRSKSTLITALNEVIAASKIAAHYFPAYEIIREELNDWHYYKEDRMHPTAEAIDLVFERFYKACFPTNASTLGAEL